MKSDCLFIERVRRINRTNLFLALLFFAVGALVYYMFFTFVYAERAGHRTAMDFFLNVGTPVLLLAGSVFFRYIQYRDFTVHPAVKILQTDTENPMDVANAIGAEMAKPEYEACKFMITDHWIVSKDDLRVLSLAQIERMTLCDRIEQIRQHHTNAVLGYRKTGKKLALVFR